MTCAKTGCRCLPDIIKCDANNTVTYNFGNLSQNLSTANAGWGTPIAQRLHYIVQADFATCHYFELDSV